MRYKSAHMPLPVIQIMAALFFVLSGVVGERLIMASEQEASLQKVRATTLLRLSQFIDWPESDKPHYLCYFNETDLTEEFTLMAPKLSGLNLLTLQVKTPEQISDCRLIYLEEQNLPAGYPFSLEDLHILGIVTAGTIEGFASEGGMFELALVKATSRNKNQTSLKQEIRASRKAIKDFPFSINSRLLQLLKPVD